MKPPCLVPRQSGKSELTLHQEVLEALKAHLENECRKYHFDQVSDPKAVWEAYQSWLGKKKTVDSMYKPKIPVPIYDEMYEESSKFYPDPMYGFADNKHPVPYETMGEPVKSLMNSWINAISDPAASIFNRFHGERSYPELGLDDDFFDMLKKINKREY